MKVGNKYNRLTILEIVKSRHSKATCQCDCGVVKTFILSNVVSGKSKSCGCLYKETRGKQGFCNYNHGEANKTPEYQTWKAMLSRCNNPNRPDYYLYGGRGIQVCQEWKNDYTKFLSDMGRRPSDNHSIDRIDVNGNYEPKNCRWATAKEQRMNQR